jgi:hypothetical protein
MGTRQVPLCWPGPVCSVSGYSLMSLVSVSSGHAKGTVTLQLLGAVRVGTGKKLPTLPRGRYPCCACSQPYVERPHPLLPVGVVQQGKIVEPTPGQAKTFLQTPVCPQHAARDIEANPPV